MRPWLLVAGLVLGCGSEDSGIVMCFEGTDGVTQADVTVTFLAAEGGPACQLEPIGTVDLPDCVAARRGRVYDFAMAAEAVWGPLDAPSRREILLPFRKGTVIEATVLLAHCACGRGEQCVDGTCLDVPTSGLFGDAGAVPFDPDGCTLPR